jgi:hypothetical protein
VNDEVEDTGEVNRALGGQLRPGSGPKLQETIKTDILGEGNNLYGGLGVANAAGWRHCTVRAHIFYLHAPSAHLCLHTHTPTLIYTNMHRPTHLLTHTHMNTNRNHTHTCTHTHLHIDTNTYILTCTHTHRHHQTHTTHTYTHMHKYTHTHIHTNVYRPTHHSHLYTYTSGHNSHAASLIHASTHTSTHTHKYTPVNLHISTDMYTYTQTNFSA